MHKYRISRENEKEGENERERKGATHLWLRWCVISFDSFSALLSSPISVMHCSRSFRVREREKKREREREKREKKE